MGGSGTVRAQQAVQDIMRYLGVPYVWSGSSPAGVDCIGLLRLVGRDLGVNIPQTGNVFTDMAVGGGGVVGQDGNWAATVGQLAPGDILYYGSSGPNGHGVMYIGNGMIIQAAHQGTTVSISPLFSAASSTEPFAGARRYF